MTEAAKTGTASAPIGAGGQALRIANAVATRAYRDLSVYAVRLALEEDGWHFDYELKDPKRKGGGPPSIIHPQMGATVSQRYSQ